MIRMSLISLNSLFSLRLLIQLMLFIDHLNLLIDLYLITLDLWAAFYHIVVVFFPFSLWLWFSYQICYTFTFVSLVLWSVLWFVYCYYLELFFVVFLFCGLWCCQKMLLFYFYWRVCFSVFWDIVVIALTWFSYQFLLFC